VAVHEYPGMFQPPHQRSSLGSPDPKPPTMPQVRNATKHRLW